MNTKELNTKSFTINSKYKKHSGKRVKDIQKSRNAPLIKYDKQRKWRKYEKRAVNKNARQHTINNMNNHDFNCFDKIERIPEISYPKKF